MEQHKHNDISSANTSMDTIPIIAANMYVKFSFTCAIKASTQPWKKHFKDSNVTRSFDIHIEKTFIYLFINHRMFSYL